ncbi:MAG: hypothetical protein M0R03_13460 [Novosphingobium sp.]|nr:hypothetical protein [Novosphingobium sp.]
MKNLSKLLILVTVIATSAINANVFDTAKGNVFGREGYQRNNRNRNNTQERHNKNNNDRGLLGSDGR